MRAMNRALRTALTAGLLLGFAIEAHGAGAAKNKSADLEATAQAKAYRAMQKVLASGNYEAYRKCLTSETLRKVDQMMKDLNKTPKELMAFAKDMAPTDVKFTDLTVDGKKAVLSATGKMDGAPATVAIDLAEEDGRWKVGAQNFK